MPKATSLLADVDAAAKSFRNRTTWFDMLGSEAQSELLAARQKWHAGGFTLKRYQVSRLIVKAATNRGWKVCDEKRMAEWLDKND